MRLMEVLLLGMTYVPDDQRTGSRELAEDWLFVFTTYIVVILHYTRLSPRVRKNRNQYLLNPLPETCFQRERARPSGR